MKWTYGVLALAFSAAIVDAQLVPWEIFDDAASDSTCDVINANNFELVVLSGTRELTIVTGRDVTLGDTEVDAAGCVFFEGQPAGFITFDFDGDGFRTLWWVSLTGRVVDVDGFTGEPSETDMIPADYRDVPCDACDFWDDQTVCDEPPVVDRPPFLPLCGFGMLSTMLFSGLVLSGLKLVRRRW